MRTVFAIAGLFCTLPLLASAQSGFPDKPLWLSSTTPVSGQEITLSTVLYNGTEAKVDSTLTFFVDDVALAPQEVSLPPQSSRVVSAKWVASAGAHTLSARFGSSSSATQQTTAIQVVVPEPPPLSEIQQNVTKAAGVAGQFASSSAPFVQNIAQTIFAQTESVRTAAAEKLEEYIDDSRRPLVAGNSIHATTSAVKGFAAPANSNTEKRSLLGSTAQTAAVAAYFVFNSVYLFYLVFVPLLCMLLLWAYRKLLRPGR
jgi:hypothetical protein